MNEELQLLITLNIIMSDKASKPVPVLIVTVVNGNVARMGFLPQHISEGRGTLNFVTENGGKLESGTYTVECSSNFKSERRRVFMRKKDKMAIFSQYTSMLIPSHFIPMVNETFLGRVSFFDITSQRWTPSAICKVYHEKGTPRGVRDPTRSYQKR